MSKRANIFIAMVFIAFMTATIISMFFSCQEHSEVSAENPTTQQTEKKKMYSVKEYNGLVAVFDAESGFIVKITDTYVSSLPNDDRKKLSEGIKIDDDEKLRKLLEDLCS